MPILQWKKPILRGIKWLAYGHTPSMRKPKAFQVLWHLFPYYFYFIKDKRLFLGVIYRGEVSEVNLSKTSIPRSKLVQIQDISFIPNIHKT